MPFHLTRASSNDRVMVSLPFIHNATARLLSSAGNWKIDQTVCTRGSRSSGKTSGYLRAERLHPGAKANLFDTDRIRDTTFLTNAPRYNVAFLDARHRARGRCENRVKTLKNAGLGKLPYHSYAANTAWRTLPCLP